MFGFLATSGTAMGAGGMIGYIIFLVAIFYFLLIRPQRKSRKERASMLEALQVGAEIYTSGGILGTVTRIKEHTIWLRISEKCEIELLKSAIGGINNSNNMDEIEKKQA